MLERITHRGDYHPDLRGIATVLPKGVTSARTVPFLRRALSIARRGGGVSSTASIDNGVGLRVFEPQTSIDAPRSRGAFLWIHGGGTVMGQAAQDDEWCRYLADEEGIVVVSVDYRLAPEHPFPEPVDDCVAALEWIIARPDVDPRRIAVGGASAGGLLAAAVAFRARDAGISLALQMLVYPMLDDRTTRDDVRYRLWDVPSNDFAWRSFLGDADTELAVPARRTDLRGLAPAWIGVGSLDLFLDEDLDYARRLRDAGVACEIHIVDGAFHAFDAIARRAGVSREFAEVRRKALTAAFAASTD